MLSLFLAPLMFVADARAEAKAKAAFAFAEEPKLIVPVVKSAPIDDGWRIQQADDPSYWNHAYEIPTLPERLTSTIQIVDPKGDIHATLQKPTRQQIATALEKAKADCKTVTRAPTGHTRTCPSCNITWDHQANPGHNCPQCGREQRIVDQPSRPVTVKAVSLSASPKSTTAQPDNRVSLPVGCVDAFDEVNRQRATRGLRPYIRDEGLMKAAADCAAYRAANRIHGHTNDFAFVPKGSSASCAGCAAWAEGFGACEIFGNWTYAGAAYVVGADGLRYCHLFLR